MLKMLIHLTRLLHDLTILYLLKKKNLLFLSQMLLMKITWT